MRKRQIKKNRAKTDKLTSILKKYPVEVISLYVGFRYIEFRKQGLKFKVITYFLTAIVAAFLSDKYLKTNLLPKLPNSDNSVIDAINQHHEKRRSNNEKLLNQIINKHEKTKSNEISRKR